MKKNLVFGAAFLSLLTFVSCLNGEEKALRKVRKCLIVPDLTVADASDSKVHERIRGSVNQFFLDLNQLASDLNKKNSVSERNGDWFAVMPMSDANNPAIFDPIKINAREGKTTMDLQAFKTSLEENKSKVLAEIDKAVPSTLIQSPYITALETAISNGYTDIHFMGDMRVYEGSINFENNKNIANDCEMLQKKIVEKIGDSKDKIKITFQYIRKEMVDRKKDNDITKSNEDVLACWQKIATETSASCVL